MLVGLAVAWGGTALLLSPASPLLGPPDQLSTKVLGQLGLWVLLGAVVASAVVSNGIYRFSRNPMCLGFLLALAKWAVYLSNALAALFLPAFVAYMNQFQIKAEERALRAKFGPAFSQYMAAVRQWI
jgi:protein-S-isoprenylcysteine O-methyltransferase Ste14